MKYDWVNATDEQKINAVKHELSLITHMGTTKDDLLNMLKWLWEKFEAADKDLVIQYKGFSEKVYFPESDPRTPNLLSKFVIEKLVDELNAQFAEQIAACPFINFDYTDIYEINSAIRKLGFECKLEVP